MAMIDDRVERTATDQRLNRAAVHHALVHAAAEIEQVAERPFFARLDDVDDGSFARALYRAEAVGHGLFVRRRKTVAG